MIKYNEEGRDAEMSAFCKPTVYIVVPANSF